MTTWNIPLQLNNLQAEISHQQAIGLTNPLNTNIQANGFYSSGASAPPAGTASIVLGGGQQFLVETTDLTPQLSVNNSGVQLGLQGTGYTVTAPTVTNSADSSQQVATTAFVQSAIGSGQYDVLSVSTTLSGLTPQTATKGNVVIGGTLNPASGGTGVTTATGYLYGNGTSAMTSSTTIPTTALSGTITNAQLANSTISGVALGGNLANLTIGSGLTGTSSTYNGSTADTISIPTSGVTAGSYNTANITVNSQGIITSASTGAGGVTSFSAGTTGLTPNTATGGAITLGGTLAVANGGTGVTTSTGTGSTVLSASPALTGVPTAPTATTGTNTTQLATTAFVSNALGSTTAFVPPAVTTYTSGSGTYTVPANALYLTVEMVGGGGGGGGSGGGNLPLQGGTGGTTTFGTSLLTCNGGGGGAYGTPSILGGTATISSPAVGTTIQGGASGSGSTNISGYIGGQAGGTSFFGGGGGGGNNSAGTAGASNTGAGGGSAGTNSGGGTNTGAGGSAGGSITAVIPNPLSATYSYSVGAGGAGGSAGTSGYAGGAGGSGVIIITAYFSAITQTLSQINSTVTAQTGNVNYYPVFVSGDTTGSYPVQVDGGGKLYYNPSTGVLSSSSLQSIASSAFAVINSTATGQPRYLDLANSADSSNSYIYCAGNSMGIVQADSTINSTLYFSTQNVEAMRINGYRNILMGTITDVGAKLGVFSAGLIGQFTDNNSVKATPVIQASAYATASTSWYAFVAQSGNGSAVSANTCFIYGNGNIVNTNNSYGVISDRKLKHKIRDCNSQWDDVKKLGKAMTKYTLTADPEQKEHIGWVAQDVEQISAGATFTHNDFDIETNEPTGDTTKGVVSSIIYMKAIKALSEAMDRIEALEARLAKAGL